MKLRGQDGPEYEVVSVPSETSPFRAKTTDEMPSLPPSHQPLPAIPLPEAPSGGGGGVAKKEEEEGMYDNIPGDQWLHVESVWSSDIIGEHRKLRFNVLFTVSIQLGIAV